MKNVSHGRTTYEWRHYHQLGLLGDGGMGCTASRASTGLVGWQGRLVVLAHGFSENAREIMIVPEAMA